MGRWRLKEYNIPIRIKQTTVYPGDIVIGDKDGVLVVPQVMAQEVLLKAEELVRTENHVRNDIINGIHPLESYYKHGWF